MQGAIQDYADGALVWTGPDQRLIRAYLSDGALLTFAESGAIAGPTSSERNENSGCGLLRKRRRENHRRPRRWTAW